MRQRLPGDEACLDSAHVMLIEEVYIYIIYVTYMCIVYDVMYLGESLNYAIWLMFAMMRIPKIEFGVFIQMLLC